MDEGAKRLVLPRRRIGIVQHSPQDVVFPVRWYEIRWMGIGARQRNECDLLPSYPSHDLLLTDTSLGVCAYEDPIRPSECVSNNVLPRFSNRCPDTDNIAAPIQSLQTATSRDARSEEHTSELQSPMY